MGMGQQGNNPTESRNVEGADWDTLRDDVGDIANVAVERGRSFIYAARDQATDYADKRKEDVAQSVTDFAASLREATSSFEDRPNIRAVVDSAVDGLDGLADSIRDRSFAEIFSDVEGVVRQRPMVFAAATFAVGFLAARFIKSTADDLNEERYVRDRQATGRASPQNR